MIIVNVNYYKGSTVETNRWHLLPVRGYNARHYDNIYWMPSWWHSTYGVQRYSKTFRPDHSVCWWHYQWWNFSHKKRSEFDSRDSSGHSTDWCSSPDASYHCFTQQVFPETSQISSHLFGPPEHNERLTFSSLPVLAFSSIYCYQRPF